MSEIAASTPKISVIIPTLNQGRFIEATLRSVLDQHYPALELIVMDGGSTDATPAILRRHASSIAHLESAPDRGQSHAINKGLARATGEVWCYLNSDDLLLPGSLARIGALFSEPRTEWVGAVTQIFDDESERGTVTPAEPRSAKELLSPWARSVEHVFPCSTTNFMHRRMYERLGGFDESYHYSMDMEYCTRAHFAGFRLRRIPDVLGRWRWHAGSKTILDGQAYRFLEEELRIAEAYMDRLDEAAREHLQREIALHRKSFLVRRALHQRGEETRRSRLRRLLVAALQHPSLLWFRPWIGAVRRQVVTP